MNSILVPLDGSTFAEAALPIALRLARDTKATLALVAVVEPEWVQLEQWSTDSLRVELEQYLSEVGRRLADLSAQPESIAVVDGPVARTLEHYATAERVRFIVMSTHGRGAVHRAWLGSVADHVVRHVEIPLVVVRPVESVPERLGEAPPLRVILVPLDGSPRAEGVLEWVVRIARAAHSECRLVTVVPPPPRFSSPYIPHAAREVRESLEGGRQRAEQYLHGVAQRLREAGMAVTTRVEVGVRPAAGILRAADDPSVDLVAIATHGRGGVSRIMLGSVADKVVRAADLPVLVVRS